MNKLTLLFFGYYHYHTVLLLFQEEERKKEEPHSREIVHISMTLVGRQEIHCCSQQNTKYDDNNEYLHALVEVASSFLKILLYRMIDKTMVAAVVRGE
ncbi:MAG: hypothetical protein JO327_09540 [Nitrososphaeraceae archaeon]|nr:hypothetical protein [Nitrososphaeraceae archaeon]